MEQSDGIAAATAVVVAAQPPAVVVAWPRIGVTVDATDAIPVVVVAAPTAPVAMKLRVMTEALAAVAVRSVLLMRLRIGWSFL
jgi:hypothetical protein